MHAKDWVIGSDPDPTEIVRQGYDDVSHRYRGDDDTPSAYVSWVGDLIDRTPPSGAVLDLGCGCGVPLARDLSVAGYDVTGVDISEVQIERARRLVPAAQFLRDDFTRIQLPAASFEAIVCLYAIIHVPQELQPALITKIAAWLRPGGWLLITAGQEAWTGSQERWLGGTKTMWWSQLDADSYRQLMVTAGLEVVEQRFIPEGSSGHSLFWARRPAR
jgi:2-polyprenyl-3-methyl-5-hydroxy-6-metoxy-1,4-benzoquinol methylase